MRVVDAIAEWMEQAGITHYFGYAGGALWPFLDALIDHPNMEGIQAKHESHAVHMADIYWRTTGKLAPVLVTKGPGLLNCVGGVATAMHDMSAVMVIVGSGPTHFLGKGGMQEIYYQGFEDGTSVMRPLTKGSWLMVRPDTVLEVMNHAYKLATSGRPGPVFLQLPIDIQQVPVEGEIELPSRRAITSRPRPDADSIDRAVDLLANAKRPVLLGGGGAAHAQAGDVVRALAERLNIPVATTLTAKGLLDETHPLSFGVTGRSGAPIAVEATRNADLVVAAGARFSDNHTSNWRNGKVYDLERTKIIQVDLDIAEVGRNYPIDLGIAGDARLFLEELDAHTGDVTSCWDEWTADLQRQREAWREEIAELIGATTSPVHPARLCHEIGEAIAAVDGRVFCDIGDITQYAEPYMTIRGPGRWAINPGMAEMGWASSGVLGAIAADPARPAIAIVGDGAFNMTSQVIASAVEYQLPAVWVILDNGEFGIERKGANRLFDRSHPWYSFTRKDTGEPYNPDYTKLAEANGARGARVEAPADLRGVLDEALSGKTPFVIDVVQDTSVATYFTPGIDRAYPNDWRASYPHHGSLQIKT